MPAARSIPSSFIDPLVLARIGTLELVARTVVNGFLNGLHRSPHLGLSLDFAEHRGYMPGDDLRRIDWRLYARTDRYYVKEFEAETNTNFLLLLDVSRSMSFRGAGIPKLDYARYLAASLAYFVRQQRDRVGMATFDTEIVDWIPAAARHAEVVLHTLDRMDPGRTRPGSLASPLRAIAERAPRRGMLALISDLYEPADSVLEALAPLRGGDHDLMVFHVLDPLELEFPFDKAADFVDLETGARLPVVPRAVRARYRSMLDEHLEALARGCRENAIDYVLLDTSKPLDHALFTFLSSRQRLSRVR